MRTYLTLLGLLLALSASAQLSVASSGMTVLTGTALTVDGLSLIPSATLNLTSNSIKRTSTPLANNPSISRLYQFGAPFLFSGRVGISYLPGELNGYTESTLQVAYAPAPSTNLTVTTSSTVNATTHYVQNTLTSQNLYVVTATALSDLSPIVYARPTTVYGSAPFTVVIDVVELNSVATSGSFTVRVTKDQKLNLDFDPGLTSVNGRTVQNSVWSLDNSNPNYYILTTSQSVAAGDRLSFGLTGQLSPGASSGIVTVSSTVLPATVVEARLNNNIDADKVEYFQQ
ncbi:hypothetical protein [Spirosoma validum]|uniref:DUF4397 domain-containing protein n=1 Tax=Spirosoma validum TaxID=2771355 RepID=A0A927B7M0_9BACT|nr:hypothetical protein [Spirosoma validum]MBD2757221.1 hypothetical protein [Spirosoma validum]